MFTSQLQNQTKTTEELPDFSFQFNIVIRNTFIKIINRLSPETIALIKQYLKQEEKEFENSHDSFTKVNFKYLKNFFTRIRAGLHQH